MTRRLVSLLMFVGIALTNIVGGIALAGASPGGGPDYSTVAMTVELQSVVLPAEVLNQPVMVEIAGEQVPWAMDLAEWIQLNGCESHDWHLDARFDGGLQFDPPTWIRMGGGEFAPTAWQASIADQITVARRVRTVSGWGQWPGCTRSFHWAWGPQPNEWALAA